MAKALGVRAPAPLILMAETSIEWTDTVWNPTRGCSRVNPDCDRCYAMGQARRSYKPGGAYEGLTTIRAGKVDWKGRARFIPNKLGEPLHWRKGRRIFVNSMSDLFHESLSNEEIAAVFGVMAACPQHTFQILTKRPKRMREWFRWYAARLAAMPTLPADAHRAAARPVPSGLAVVHASQLLGLSSVHFMPDKGNYRPSWPLPNVHLGVSAGHQAAYDKFVPVLQECPAAVRWVSVEPMTEEIDLRFNRLQIRKKKGVIVPLRGPDWIVVGGESGNGARACEIDWIRSIVQQCERASTPCFVKQLGRHVADVTRREGWVHDGAGRLLLIKDSHGGDMAEWPLDLRVREFPRAA